MAARNDDAGAVVERVKGKVEEVAGSVVGNEDLQAEGRLRQAKAHAQETAATRAERAEQEKAKAEVISRARELEAEQVALTAEAASDARQAQIERRAKADHQHVELEQARRVAALERDRLTKVTVIELDEAAAAKWYAENLQEADRLDAEARRFLATEPAGTAEDTNPSGLRRLTRAPVNVVELSLRAARLPLHALATVTAEDARTWAPLLALDATGAAVKQVLGSVTRDDGLVRDATATRAQIRRFRQAANFAAAAAQLRTDAEREFQRRHLLDEERRDEVEQATESAEERLQQQRREEQDRLEKNATARRDAGRQADAASRRAVARQKRAARATRVATESRAVRDEQAALAAEDVVERLDDAVERKKVARRRGSG